MWTVPEYSACCSWLLLSDRKCAQSLQIYRILLRMLFESCDTPGLNESEKTGSAA